MARRKVRGVCRICGTEGQLTFEHVPPRAAFNDRPVILAKAEAAFDLGPDDPFPRGRIQQRGSGAYTLCGPCNNNTGAWYGNHFAAWCGQGMEIMAYSGGRASLFHLHYVFPLSIIKQILVMFFSVNGEAFHTKHPELVRFVLDRDRKYLPPKYRVFVYFMKAGRPRSTGVAGSYNVRTGKVITLSEFSFPPFGYVLTFGSDPPDERLFEISHFSRYAYGEFVVMDLQLPALPSHMAFPGDYRTKDEIYRDAARNQEDLGEADGGSG